MKKNNNTTPSLRKQYISTFYRNNILYFLLGLLAIIGISATQLWFSYLLQEVIDVASRGTMSSFVAVAWQVLYAFLVFVLAYFLYSVFYPKFIFGATRRYKEYAYGKILKKNIFSFNKETPSSYISALTNDLQSIQTNYLSNFFQIVMQTLLLMGALIMMIIYSPLLTAISLVLAALPIVITILFGKKLVMKEKQVSESNSSFVRFLSDTLGGFSVIKSFKAEARINALYKQSNSKLEKSKQQRSNTDITLEMLGMISSTLSQFGVFVIGAYMCIRDGSITPGIIIVFVQLLNYVVAPISTLPRLIAGRRAALPLIDKLATACETEEEVNRTQVATLDNSITLRDVTFGYEEDQPIVKGLNYTFQAGKSYALVGASGSGKTTLLKLLVGISDTYSGDILFDDNSMKDISLDSIYDLASLVEQGVFIFDSTIEDNITMYGDFPTEEIKSVVNRSGLSKLIEEKGIEYSCGAGGSGLSGGEKQRVAIARGLIRKSKLLLMDEATSALDNETSVAVSNAVLDLQGITKIVITHRMEKNVLSRYDDILLLNNGTICEHGTFEQLMAQGKLFYSMYNIAQAGN